MNATVKQVKAATFKEALMCFLSYCDSSVDIDTIAAFKQLKSKETLGFNKLHTVEHINEKVYWHGNHFSRESRVEIMRVEEPCLFYVVKYSQEEYSDCNNSFEETHVFVC